MWIVCATQRYEPTVLHVGPFDNADDALTFATRLRENPDSLHASVCEIATVIRPTPEQLRASALDQM